MIGRIIWFAALAVIALLAAALQVDMQSRSSARLAQAVPAPLRNYAQVQIAQDAVNGADSARAIAEAERLVRRRPLPAENLTLLATAQVKAGQLDQAGQTIQLAGQRGWRDPAAQEAVLRLALAAGDKAEAARRYAALFLRQRTPDRMLEELGPAVLGETGGVGQQTMVAIVIGGERWHAQFLRRGPRVMPPAAFSAIAADSLTKGTAFDCRLLGQSINVLSRRDASAAAALRSASTQRCPALADKSRSKRPNNP